jgi:signal transduction histidine kinase/PAS domain-containing protein
MSYTVKRRIHKPSLWFNDNIVSRVNHEFEKLSGYSRSELLGKTAYEINKMLKTESQVSYGYYSSRKSLFIFTKELEPVEVVVSRKLHGADNERIYYFDKKRNSSVFDLLPYVISTLKDNQLGVVVYSAYDGIVLQANEKFLNILNVPSCNIGDYIGKGLREISEMFDESNYQEIFFNAVKTGMPFHSKEFKAFDHSDVYWNVSLVPIAISGEVKYVVYTVSDVTEDVVRRKVVEEQKQNLEAIIENMSDSLFMVDKDYNIEALNSVAKCSALECDILGLAEGLLMYDFEENEITFDNHPANRILRGEKLSCFRYSLQKPHCTCYLSLSGSPVYHDGNITKALICIRDITEQVMNDRLIIKQEEMKTSLKVQDEIFSNASHELKTPLSVIYSANQMMDIYLNDCSLSKDMDKFSTYNKIIKQNCFRLTRLINNITDLTKCRSGYVDFIINNENIVEVIRNITQTVSEHFKSKGIKIEFQTDIEEKTIACDADKIERIMLNLISNSIKFSENESTIVVSIHDKGDAVEIKVSDNGIGIDSKHIDCIFERYYQADKSISRKVEGSGIGLPLVKEFVELHSGQIIVESEIGKGSTFIVELPVKIAENEINFVHPSAINKFDMIEIEFSDIYNLNN